MIFRQEVHRLGEKKTLVNPGSKAGEVAIKEARFVSVKAALMGYPSRDQLMSRFRVRGEWWTGSRFRRGGGFFRKNNDGRYQAARLSVSTGRNKYGSSA